MHKEKYKRSIGIERFKKIGENEMLREDINEIRREYERIHPEDEWLIDSTGKVLGRRKNVNWTREKILRNMRQRKEVGFTTTAEGVFNENPKLYHAVLDYFNSWEGLYEELGYALPAKNNKVTKTRRRWTKEKILEEMKERVESNLGVKPRELQKEYQALYKAVRKNYESWEELYEELGIEVRIGGKWSKEDIRVAMKQRLKNNLAVNPYTVYSEHRALYNAALKNYDSWEELYKELGIEEPRKRLWTKERIREEIEKRVESNLSVKSTEIRNDNVSLYAAVRRYYGTWENFYREMGEELTRETFSKMPWTKETIKEAIKTRQEEGLSIKPQVVRKENPRLYSAVGNHFGSWKNLRNGLEKDQQGPVVEES